MWIVKEKPEDFIVVEDIALPDKGEGVFLYFLRKSGRTTLSVVKEIQKTFGIRKGDIVFAGMKDRDGITYQYLTTVKFIGEKVDGEGYTLWHIDNVSKHVEREALRGNVFAITLRGAVDVKPDLLPHGFVNYFDYQRFAVFSEGMAAQLLLERKYKDALWTLLTPGTRQRIKDAFRDENFSECLKLARTPWERRIFKFLKKKGPKYKDALKYVDGDQRAISMLAYQSYLWNKTVSKIIERCSGDVSYISVGDVSLATAPDLRNCHYKVPFITWFLAEEWWELPSIIRDAIREVMDEEGWGDFFDLKTKIHGYTLVLRYRDVVAKPYIKGVYSGSDLTRVVFYLQRGSYATMYIKQLALFHGEEVLVK